MDVIEAIHITPQLKGDVVPVVVAALRVPCDVARLADAPDEGVGGVGQGVGEADFVVGRRPNGEPRCIPHLALDIDCGDKRDIIGLWLEAVEREEGRLVGDGESHGASLVGGQLVPSRPHFDNGGLLDDAGVVPSGRHTHVGPAKSQVAFSYVLRCGERDGGRARLCDDGIDSAWLIHSHLHRHSLRPQPNRTGETTQELGWRVVEGAGCCETYGG
mmetsp:Transcript_54587/g.118795  ORF Transcript_54587/g.118795 Transcript_54587/m.118795 type:complete len:216 (-) Transcript_54587:208-855(-)